MVVDPVHPRTIINKLKTVTDTGCQFRKQSRKLNSLMNVKFSMSIVKKNNYIKKINGKMMMTDGIHAVQFFPFEIIW